MDLFSFMEEKNKENLYILEFFPQGQRVVINLSVPVFYPHLQSPRMKISINIFGWVTI